MNEITTINTDDYAVMAKAMGFASENKKSTTRTVILPCVIAAGVTRTLPLIMIVPVREFTIT